ncbi:hypothetical protein J4859_11455 [Atopobium sp. oral taxon 416]|nr:hypothetical protein J4859_11455 [Atopobium sp. oral taxon 416]
MQRLYTALKQLGIGYVFNIFWSADLTIMEEDSELLEKLRLEASGKPQL